MKTRQMLYSALYTAVMIAGLPYFAIAGLLRGKYISTFRARLGFLPDSVSAHSIWVHAVSVGEFLAVRPLLKKMQQQLHPIPIAVSSTTLTGHKLAHSFSPDQSFYFPFDWRWCIRKAFRKVKPRFIVVMETEIWPNFLWEAERQNIPVILVNGRLSDRTFSRYMRVRKWLPQFDQRFAQSEEDARRISRVGLSRHEVRVSGNIKYDFKPQPMTPELRNLLDRWKGDVPVLIAGSTMKGEEPEILRAYAGLLSRQPVKLLLAPRHPERFEEIAAMIGESGIRYARRSLPEKLQEADILLLDSIGELASCYEIADVALIGGTLAPPGGGHNPIEPAYFGKAIVSGKGYVNFRAMTEEFLRKNAIVVTNNLESTLSMLFTDSQLRSELGKAALNLVRHNSGATDFVCNEIERMLTEGDENRALQHV